MTPILTLLTLSTPADAGAFDTPTRISWELRGASTECSLLLTKDVPLYQCGASNWTAVERSTKRLDRALKRLSPGRLLNATPEGGRLGPTLTLHAPHGAIAFSIATPELLEVVAAARELIAVEDPLAVPEVAYAGCDVALHRSMRPTRYGAMSDELQSRDLIVCESGAWFGYEEGHEVARGWIDEGSMADLMELAAPLPTLGPDPRARLEPVLCPTVEETHFHGLMVRGEAVPRNACGYAIHEQQPFDQRLRQLVPFPGW